MQSRGLLITDGPQVDGHNPVLARLSTRFGFLAERHKQRFLGNNRPTIEVTPRAATSPILAAIEGGEDTPDLRNARALLAA